MSKPNTCPSCGHAIAKHSVGGCGAKINSASLDGTTFYCPCNANNSAPASPESAPTPPEASTPDSVAVEPTSPDRLDGVSGGTCPKCHGTGERWTVIDGFGEDIGCNRCGATGRMDSLTPLEIINAHESTGCGIGGTLKETIPNQDSPESAQTPNNHESQNDTPNIATDIVHEPAPTAQYRRINVSEPLVMTIKATFRGLGLSDEAQVDRATADLCEVIESEQNRMSESAPYVTSPETMSDSMSSAPTTRQEVQELALSISRKQERLAKLRAQLAEYPEEPESAPLDSKREKHCYKCRNTGIALAVITEDGKKLSECDLICAGCIAQETPLGSRLDHQFARYFNLTEVYRSVSCECGWSTHNCTTVEEARNMHEEHAKVAPDEINTLY